MLCLRVKASNKLTENSFQSLSIPAITLTQIKLLTANKQTNHTQHLMLHHAIYISVCVCVHAYAFAKASTRQDPIS